MSMVNKHPLHLMADRLKKAFVLHGFSLKDNGESRELIPVDASFSLFNTRSIEGFKAMETGDGAYMLRTSLLGSVLAGYDRQLPCKVVTSGFAYDMAGSQYPQHLLLEAVIACPDLTKTDLETLLTGICQEAFGVNAEVSYTYENSKAMTICVETDGKVIKAGQAGQASWMVRALLGQTGSDLPVWVIRIDVDDVVMQTYAVPDRKALYSPLAADLSAYGCPSPSFGGDFSSRARNVLRRHGFMEFVGERIYSADAYVRMNMIQEAWDTNNVAITLKDPVTGYENPLTELKQREGLPTVLAPSLEQAMSENFAAGIKEVKLFEIGHIFKPAKTDGQPWEKVSLSFGAYGPDLTMQKFKAEVDQVLTELGISNHFFIPTDMAIAYKTDECCVILDEKMKYLDGNCGHISPVALKNFRIDAQAYMAQFELDTIENKSDEEYGFVPYELR